MIYLNIYIASKYNLSRKLAFFYPLAIGMLLYTILKSVYLAYKNNGIIWRDTHYLLKKLRSKATPAKLNEN